MKKHTWKGLAVVAAMLLSVGLMSQTVFAAAPTTVNVIIDEGLTAVGGNSAEDNDTLVSDADDAQVVNVVVDVDDSAVATGGQSNETIVTLTTSIGTWANGSTTIQVQCANDGADNLVVTVDDTDAVADSDTAVGITEGTFNGAVEAGTGLEDPAAADEGCAGVMETLIIPAGVAVGTYAITAQTTNGVVDVDNLVIQAAAGGTPTKIEHIAQSHDSIGFTGTGYSPWVNGTVWQVRVTDANGNGVAGRQVQFTADQGVVLVDASTVDSDGNPFGTLSETEVNTACATTTTHGTTDIELTGTIGTTATNTGRAQVVACGTSAAGGKEATLTATVVGTSLAAATDKITVSLEPVAADIVATTSGNTVTVNVKKGTIPAPDDTLVTFLVVPTDQAVVSQQCVELHDGVATTTFAVSGGNPQVLVSVVDAENGADDGSCPVVAVGENWGSATVALVGGGGGGTTPPPAQGACAGFIGQAPARGSIALLVTNGTCTAPQLVSAFATAGCTVESLAILEGGVWKIYINGAPAVVNTAFPASLPPTTAFFVRCQA